MQKMTKSTTVLIVMLIAEALNFALADDSSALNHRIFIRQVLGGYNPANAGGYRPVSVNDPDVVRAADFATRAISASNSVPVIRIRIVQAWKQVVNGTNYRLILELRNTNTGRDVLLCQVIVFEPLSTNTLELNSSLCAPKRDICGQTDM
uniref:Cystatin domain-containing protein n=1 Tax=Daphnia galeata TaxID=27404 RepID=A0A8J2RNQ8_9CRUS|nr:unnamed protein product [Daphnia galeata]